MGDVGNWEVVYVWGQGVSENYMFSTQFCCEPKTALKKIILNVLVTETKTVILAIWPGRLTGTGIVQFSSDTNHPELSSDSTAKGMVPNKTATTSDTSCKSGLQTTHT